MNISTLLIVFIALLLSPLLSRAEDALTEELLQIGEATPLAVTPSDEEIIPVVAKSGTSLKIEDEIPEEIASSEAEPEPSIDFGPAPGSLEYEMRTINMLSDALPPPVEENHRKVAKR